MCDTQPAAVGGALNEFIFSAQLDNLMCSYLAVQALIRAEGAESDPNIKLVALFDNEECGSESAQGANSNMLQQVIERTIASLNEQRNNSAELTHITLRKSFLVSADMAHAIHPNVRNYASALICVPPVTDPLCPPSLHSTPRSTSAITRQACSAVPC